MKGVVILVLIFPTVLGHIINGYRPRFEDYDQVSSREHVVQYNVPVKHMKQHQLSNRHRSHECKWSGHCSCLLLPTGRWIPKRNEETGLIKKFREVMCVGDRAVVNSTAPIGYYYRCNPKDEKHLIPNDLTYKNKPECDCEYDDISNLNCSNKD